MIACQHLTKRFGEFLAVEDISFRVPGGICALLGPNGAGKSTLLKMLTGLLTPDEGQAQVAGCRVLPQTLDWRYAIGVVPEALALFDSLTVKEHLELCAPVYGVPKRESQERIRSLLRILGLQAGQDTFLDQCSHGMRKKTALAMALLHNPRVLFLDEPFEGIDPLSSKTIRDLLSTISQRGITVFFTSHLLATVEQLATEIMVIRQGRIVWASATQGMNRSLEELYFDLVETPPVEDLAWLRSPPS